jgi:hypothetical protein
VRIARALERPSVGAARRERSGDRGMTARAVVRSLSLFAHTRCVAPTVSNASRFARVAHADADDARARGRER